MNTNRKKRLLTELKDKKYRDAYVSSSIDVGVAFQIRALRESKSWTQGQLAEKTNMKQPRIHELEDPSNTPSLSTLKKLANAFDVGLMVRFVPISDLVKWDDNLSTESLNAPSYDKDVYFGAEGSLTTNSAADGIKYTLTNNNVIFIESYFQKGNASTTDTNTKIGRTARS